MAFIGSIKNCSAIRRHLKLYQELGDALPTLLAVEKHFHPLALE